MSNGMRSKYTDNKRHIEKLQKLHSTAVYEKEMKFPSSLERKYQAKEKTQIFFCVNGWQRFFCVNWHMLNDIENEDNVI